MQNFGRGLHKFASQQPCIVGRKSDEIDAGRELPLLLAEILKNLGIVGKDSSFLGSLYRIHQHGLVGSPVLVVGPTGAGKEVAARVYHASGGDPSRPFVAINCAGIPETLLESELFGHEEGAFTDAKKRKDGLFRQAHGGTLFLDEIGEMSPALQAKLLRVLEDNKVCPVGGSREYEVKFGLISATNVNLHQAIKNGRFREDLLYRLGRMRVLPSLQERREDVPLLAAHFLKCANERFQKSCVIAPALFDFMVGCPWPGNVRQLKASIENAVLESGSDEIGPKDLGLDAADDGTTSTICSVQENLVEDFLKGIRAMIPNGIDRAAILEKIQCRIADAAMAHTGQVMSKAAKLIGVARQTLQEEYLRRKSRDT